VAQCEICGGQVEEHGFKVLVSGRPSEYDRIECAERGRVLAAAGGAAFVHPFKARTIVIDAPRTAAAVVASAGVAGSLLARASLARAKLAFGGAWLLATGLAATSLYLSTRPDSPGLSTSPEAAGAPTGVEEPVGSVPFVHQVDLPPVGVADAAAHKVAGKPKSKAQHIFVRNTSGNESLSAAPQAQPAPSSPPAHEPAPPPAIQPADPPPPAVPADEGSTKPGWGHGDPNHEHGGPPGNSKDK
jgi:hypothetical protein